uniref:Uncharacterized protein n=1 Tax=Molossus molossus TaxID=27622 RepID=A0A7J8C930_MOLMO|nr:hypothetical protein HJG59_009976 [Molossus molossus]
MCNAYCHYSGRDLISPFNRPICSFLGRHGSRRSPGAWLSWASTAGHARGSDVGLWRVRRPGFHPRLAGEMGRSVTGMYPQRQAGTERADQLAHSPKMSSNAPWSQPTAFSSTCELCGLGQVP